MFCRECGSVDSNTSQFFESPGPAVARRGETAAASGPASCEERLLRQSLVARYEILRKLGTGGMSTVYLARDVSLGREVALKVLPQRYLHDEEFVPRFKREAQIAARLEHPHIIRIYHIGDEPGVCYFAMNYIPGGSIGDRIRAQGALGVNEIVRWGQEVCAALSHAHAQGIVHRDLKPENILLDGKGRAVVMDFGIARAAEGARLTQTGVAIGTPQYMSPEQAKGIALDARSDIYSLGVVLYQMATGSLPFSAKDPASLIYQHVHEAPEPPDVRIRGVPGWLRDVILKCLAKHPGERYGRAEEVARALAECRTPGEARLAPPTERIPTVGYGRADRTSPASAPTRVRWKTGKSRASFVTGVIAGGMALVGNWLIWSGVGEVEVGRDGVGHRRAGVGNTGQVYPDEYRAPVAAPGRADTGAPSRGETTGHAEETWIGQAIAQKLEAFQKAFREGAYGAAIPALEEVLKLDPGHEKAAQMLKEARREIISGMVYIPPGDFRMGSAGGDGDEQPVHTVSVPGFYLDRYEVTNREFERFVAATGYRTDAETKGYSYVWDGEWKNAEGLNWRSPWGRETGFRGKEDHPVIHVSWNDAKAYCEWAGKRLPSEAEWEKACRGPQGAGYAWGEGTPSGRRGGNTADETARRSNPGWAIFEGYDDGYLYTAPVGRYAANGYGLYDMTGNVWEWCADWYGEDAYEQRPSENPTVPGGGVYRVLRGGSWSDGPVTARCTNRDRGAPEDRSNSTGFRCAFSVD